VSAGRRAVGALIGRGRAGRATRSLIGSVVATVVSEITFAACYGTATLGTTASSAAAFVAGAIPNYVLNRSWAWRRTGRVRVWREVVLYIIVSLISFGASAVATGLTAHAARHMTPHALKVATVSAAYLATYAVLFGAKFAAYEFVIFGAPDDAAGSGGAPDDAAGIGGAPDGGRSRRSRHQVAITTRANRAP